jgi:acyl-CoA synthetase (NDP forming)
VPDLDRLLAPRSIAVVGGAPAERVVAQCLKLGFPGPIWPVHPRRAELAGVPTVATLDDLPGVPDAVFLGVNRFATVEAMRTLATMGAGGAVCYGSGFAETGEADLQTELLDAADGMPFFGPNCYGFVNTFDRVALWPDEHGCGRTERGVAIVSQSGNVAVNLTFQQRGLRLGSMITVGNQASLGTEDAVAALIDDDRITAIGMFLEAVRDPQLFAAVAARAHARGLPLVALQTGRSAAGALIAASHTGSMSGPFADDHRTRIESTLTELVAVSNPFDYHTFMWGDREAMATCFTAVMDGPQDATMLVLDAPPSPDNDPASWYVAADALADAAAATGRRAVVVASLAECINEPFRAHISAGGLTPLLGLSEGLVALDAAARVMDRCLPAHAPVVPAATTRLVDEAAAKQRLRDLGIAAPDGRVAERDEVLDAADSIGYPVTLKALGLAHKSEAGAVKVGLRDRDELTAALAAMPDTQHGFLVESTVTDVVAEVLVTVRRDAPVGWLVSIGHGGVTTELWSDVTHLLAPVTSDEVHRALTRLRSHALLTGFRGRPPADVDALVELVVRLTEQVVGTEVVEVELNPVLVGRRGAVAVDALLLVDAASATPSSPRPSLPQEQT